MAPDTCKQKKAQRKQKSQWVLITKIELYKIQLEHW
jgi:hypothetical protein